MKRCLLVVPLLMGLAGCSRHQIVAPQYKAGTSVEVFTRNAIRHIESCQDSAKLRQIEQQYLQVELQLDAQSLGEHNPNSKQVFQIASSGLHSSLGNMASLRATYLEGGIGRQTLMNRYPFSYQLTLDYATRCERLRRGYNQAPLP